MSKQQTFADKVNKAARHIAVTCPKCGTDYSYILLVTSERSPKSGSYKFNRRQARVCKCNEKEIYN
jgi:hypothetical protein